MKINLAYIDRSLEKKSHEERKTYNPRPIFFKSRNMKGRTYFAETGISRPTHASLASESFLAEYVRTNRSTSVPQQHYLLRRRRGGGKQKESKEKVREMQFTVTFW